MIRIARGFIGVVALLLGMLLVGFMLMKRVPPATIGVKQNLLGGGIQAKDHGMGFHLGVVGMHEWHLLPATTHFLTYSGSHGSNGRAMGEQKPALDIRTKDNNTAQFDVTVTYRIKPGEGHQIVMEGNQHKYRDQADTAVNKVLRAELAQLSSEEVYDTDTRLAVVDRAMPKLTAAMGDYHLEPGRLLIRAVNFPPNYENKLTQKQLTQQQKLLDTAERKVEEKQAETEGYAAETEAMEKEKRGDWDKKLQQARSENEVAVATVLGEAAKLDLETRSAADADYETLIADGNLAVDKAEALRSELRNKALDTTGGRIYLARQAAENLQFESITLNSNDPSVPSILDIGQIVEMLIGTPGSASDEE